MNRKQDCIKQEQETFLKFYRYALEQFSLRNEETGKRAIVCAVGTLLNIARNVAFELRPSFIDKAKQLLDRCVDLSDASSYETLFTNIEDTAMGLNIPINEFSEMFKKKENAMDRVAGLEDVKEEIRRQVVYPFMYPSLYKRYNKKTGGGILLYGLPGTGKTMIAKAIAKDMQASFFPIKCSDLLSKWFGESEGNIKELFDKARQSGKAIIFFDEFEAIGMKRSGEGNEAMNRVVHELLNQMDGFEENGNHNLVILAATNRPWDVDTAFLRPGRFNRKIYVPLPSEEARKKLIALSFDGAPMGEDYCEEEVVRLTENYSGADTVEMCECAKMFAIEREIETGKAGFIGMSDIEKAGKTVRTSIAEFDVKAMENYMKATNQMQEQE